MINSLQIRNIVVENCEGEKTAHFIAASKRGTGDKCHQETFPGKACLSDTPLSGCCFPLAHTALNTRGLTHW